MPKPIKKSSRRQIPSMASLAQDLGLSTMTISRVLSGADGKVAEKTRQRVLDEARNRKIEVNYLARSFTSKRAGVIGLVTPFQGLLGSEYFARIVIGIERVTTAHDLGIALFDTRAKTADCCLVLDRFYRQRRVDGFLVVAPTLEDDFVKALDNAEAPMVLVGEVSENKSLISVDVDPEPGLNAALNELYALGHRRFGFLRGPTNLRAANRRWNIFSDFLRKTNLDLIPAWCPVADFNRWQAHQKVSDILRSNSWPTAIVAANDLMALGALNAAEEHGVHVPSELSIIGFDAIKDGEEGHLPLSTIEQPMEAVGEAAGRKLIEHINQLPTDTASNIELPSRFIIRDSHAIPPKPSKNHVEKRS